VVGIADSIEEARLKAVEGVSNISGEIFYRKDIGSPELIGKRVEMMKKIRG
jgi:phosphoribosylamine-glycine ligase